jgi:hypothetical protein
MYVTPNCEKLNRRRSVAAAAAAAALGAKVSDIGGTASSIIDVQHIAYLGSLLPAVAALSNR